MRILRASEQVAAFRTAAGTRLYRGLNLDTRVPGMEKVHQLLQSPEGWDHPDVGNHLLDWLQSGPKKGLGNHWTADPTQAEQFARWPNEHTGRGGNLQAVIEGDWDGEGEDLGRTDTHEFDEQGNRIRAFPQEQETTLTPGAKVNVTGIKVRPYDDEYWNGPSDGEDPDENHDGPWHHVFSQPSVRTALQFFPNLSGGPEAPWLGGMEPHGEMFVPNPRFKTRNPRGERGPGWLEGEPAPAPPEGERQWRQVKYDPTSSRFYHPDTGEDVGDDYEWAHGRPDSRLFVSAALSDEDRVSVAEQVMERAGHGGRQFRIPKANMADAQAYGFLDAYGQPDPRKLQRQHSKEAEGFVNGVLQANGHEGGIRVDPQHWDLREPGSGQAVTDGANYIGLKGRDTNALNLLHETAHILTRTPEHREGHGPDFQKTVHRLYHQHISPEAADTFARIVWPERTAVWREPMFLTDERSDPAGRTHIDTWLRPEDAYDERGWEKRYRGHPPDPTPTDVRWFHATYVDLPDGEILAAGKGKPPWLDHPYHGGLDNRAHWTWVEYDITHSDDWLGYMVRDHGQGFLYEVEPHAGPFPWNGDAREGWVTDYAVILRKLRSAGGEDEHQASRGLLGHPQAQLHP